MVDTIEEVVESFAAVFRYLSQKTLSHFYVAHDSVIFRAVCAQLVDLLRGGLELGRVCDGPLLDKERMETSDFVLKARFL